MPRERQTAAMGCGYGKVSAKPGTAPRFPNECPVCKAFMKHRTASDTAESWCEYLCGGKYAYAGQVSPAGRNIDTWTGRCPKEDR